MSSIGSPVVEADQGRSYKAPVLSPDPVTHAMCQDWWRSRRSSRWRDYRMSKGIVEIIDILVHFRITDDPLAAFNSIESYISSSLNRNPNVGAGHVYTISDCMLR